MKIIAGILAILLCASITCNISDSDCLKLQSDKITELENRLSTSIQVGSAKINQTYQILFPLEDKLSGKKMALVQKVHKNYNWFPHKGEIELILIK